MPAPSARFFSRTVEIYPQTAGMDSGGSPTATRSATASHAGMPAMFRALGAPTLRQFGGRQVRITHEYLTPRDVSGVVDGAILVDGENELVIHHVAAPGGLGSLYVIYCEASQ